MGRYEAQSSGPPKGSVLVKVGSKRDRAAYMNEDSRATLQFDATEQRWTLTGSNEDGQDRWSSTDNIHSDEPWCESADGRPHMVGNSWRQDEGAPSSMGLEFEGAQPPQQLRAEQRRTARSEAACIL